MPLDYAAIATPNGINEGFANLAASVARMPLARRQQWLQERKLEQEDRALAGKLESDAAVGRYHDAMAATAGQRVDAYGRRVDAQNAGDTVKLAQGDRKLDQADTGLAIRGMDTDSKIKTRADNLTERTGHHARMDDQGDMHLQISQQNADSNSDRVGLEATRAVPLTTHKEVPGDFGGTKSIVTSRNITPEERVAEGRRLMPQRHARAMNKRLDDQGDMHLQAGKKPAAPAAPVKESGKVVRTSVLRSMVEAGTFPDMESAEAAAREQGHGVVDDEQPQGP